MSGRGVIKATRLEPETGRLQYLVERNNGNSDWHYAQDPQFTGEFGDLVKKFIDEPSHREQRRRRLTVEHPPSRSNSQNHSPTSTSSSAKPVSTVHHKVNHSGSDIESATRISTRVPIRRFREVRVQAANKLARVKKDDKNNTDDENVHRNIAVPNGLLIPSPRREDSRGNLLPSSAKANRQQPKKDKRPVSPDEPMVKVPRKMTVSPTTSHSSSAESTPKATATKQAKPVVTVSAPSLQRRQQRSVQDIMRKKLLSARSRQLQKEHHRQLLSGLARSAASRLKPVSIKISPASHNTNPLSQTIVRSPAHTFEASPRQKNSTGTPFRSPQRSLSREKMTNNINISPSKGLMRPQASAHSFVPQPDSFSSTETSSGTEAASTSTASNEGHYSSLRRGPRRQAASGLLSQLRYSQIVLRHRPGWTQLWIFTTTRMQNAINPQVCEELCTALKACIDDVDTNLILISSSGPTFCSGVDLHYLLDAKDPALAGRCLSQSITALCSVILSCPKPIFVAVNGPAIGIGVGLCLLADVVLATEKATFSTPYAQLGHVPEAGLSLTLQNTIGRALSHDMLFTGRKITALEAFRAGLVSRVLWPTNFVQELLIRLDVIARSCSPALEATKFLLRQAVINDSAPSTSTAAAAMAHRNGGSDDTNSLPLSFPTAVMRAIESESELLELFYTSPESRTAMRHYVDTT